MIEARVSFLKAPPAGDTHWTKEARDRAIDLGNCWRVQRSRILASVSAPLFLSILVSCTVARDESAGQASRLGDIGNIGSTDPLEQLRVIGDAAMEGRGTPSPGQQRAADYVIAQARAAGIVGAMADDGFLQPFTVSGFPGGFGLAHGDEPPSLDEASFGSDLFEEGIYLSGAATAETQKEMGERVCAALNHVGEPCPPGIVDGSADPRPLLHGAAAQRTNNVVGVLPGSGPHRDEIVLLSAHLDHLGKTSQGLFAGADDNGSGSATLVALMNMLALANRETPFDRTIGFFWTSGEEKGLLGAAYFVDNAPAKIPMAKIKQVINMDMVGRWDDTRFSIGADNSATSQAALRMFDEANASMERPFVRINRDIQSYNSRQDGYAFSRRGVPTLFVFEGLSRPTGGGSLMPNYHRQTDTVDAMVAENGGSKIRRMGDILGRAILRVVNQ